MVEEDIVNDGGSRADDLVDVATLAKHFVELAIESGYADDKMDAAKQFLGRHHQLMCVGRMDFDAIDVHTQRSRIFHRFRHWLYINS